MSIFSELHNRKKNRSIRFTWLVSYIVVVSVLLCSMVAIYISYDIKLYNETMQFNEYAFEKVSNSVKDNMSSVNMIYQKMYNNTALEEIAKIEDADDYYKTGYKQETVDEINLYSDMIYGIDVMYFYLPKTDYVISKHGILPSKDYHGLYFDESMVDYDTWKEELSNVVNRKYSIKSYLGEFEQEEAIEHIITLNFDTSKVTMVIMTEKTKFLSGVDKIEWINKCDMYVFGPYGNLVMAEIKSGTDKEPPKDLSQLKKDSLDDIIYVTNDITDDRWVLASVVPKSVLTKKNVVFRIVIFLAIFICLIVVGFLIMFFVNKNYKPIKDLFKITNIDTDTNTQYYSQLYDEINAIINDKKNMKISIYNKEQKLSKFELSRIIHGDVSSYFINDSESIINFAWNYFAVIIFYLENIEELFEDERPQIDNNERKFQLGVIVENVMSELYQKSGYDTYFCEADNNIVCLVNMKDVKQDSYSDFIRIANLGTEIINDKFEISLIYTASNIHESVLNISTAYNQALETLKFVILYGINESMCYNENIESEIPVEIFSLSSQQNLINSLKMGNEKNAQSVVKYVFDYINENKNISPEYIKIILHDITSTIVKCAAELLELGYKTNVDMSLYKDITNNEHIFEIENRIVDYVRHICLKVNEYEKEKRNIRVQTSRITSIIEFIDNNYTNPLININHIAKTFDVGASYLSKLFKEATGEKLMDYLNCKRIQEAKRLMRETDDSLETIAIKSGFNHVRTFYRVYKKIEGISPSKSI